MPKLAITNEFIKKIKPPTTKSKEQYFDSELNGFMLEIKSTGSKTYYYRYRTNGKQKMTRIGTTNELSLEDAKKHYYELKENESNRTTQSNQEQQLNPITFQEFYDTHYLPYINTHIKSYETNISVFKNHILNHLANTKMVELKKATVMQLHSNMLHIKNLSPATANKFLIFLSNAYSLAHQFELLPNEINPCRGVKEFELNNQRQIFLSKAQAKRLLSEVEISPNIHLKYIIPMLLLTGARKREVLDATWSDFDMLCWSGFYSGTILFFYFFC